MCARKSFGFTFVLKQKIRFRSVEEKKLVTHAMSLPVGSVRAKLRLFHNQISTIQF